MQHGYIWGHKKRLSTSSLLLHVWEASDRLWFRSCVHCWANHHIQPASLDFIPTVVGMGGHCDWQPHPTSGSRGKDKSSKKKLCALNRSETCKSNRCPQYRPCHNYSYVFPKTKHRDGHEFEWALGVGEEQRSLVCFGLWGYKELDTNELLNWTELNWSTQKRLGFKYWVNNYWWQSISTDIILLSVVTTD